MVNIVLFLLCLFYSWELRVFVWRSRTSHSMHGSLIYRRPSLIFGLRLRLHLSQFIVSLVAQLSHTSRIWYSAIADRTTYMAANGRSYILDKDIPVSATYIFPGLITTVLTPGGDNAGKHTFKMSLSSRDCCKNPKIPRVITRIPIDFTLQISFLGYS